MLRSFALLSLLALAACGDDRPKGISGTSINPPALADTSVAPSVDGAAEDTARDADEEVAIVDGYPAGPYGKRKGDVFPPLTLRGYRDGALTFDTVSLRDYFDPDGSKRIRGVMLIAAAQWCGVCQSEVKWVTSAYVTNYRDRGARFITALLQNGARAAATPDTATLWRESFAIPYAVTIDPELSTLPEGSGALSLPYAYTIDPRTMRILEVTSAAQTPPKIPSLESVLEKNR
jgi:hypothetical protein